MSIKVLLASVICIAFLSCKEQQEYLTVPPETLDSLDSLIVLGLDSLHEKNLDIFLEHNRCDSLIYKLDLDQNSIYDVEFYLYHCYSPSHFYGTMKLRCLNDTVQVFTNDTLASPEILSFGDTLNSAGLWTNQSFEMIMKHQTSTIVGGDGVMYTEGNWHNIEEKYIGVKLVYPGLTKLAWIKVSIPNENIPKLHIHLTGNKEVEE